ncbi:NnrS family protein [Alsobacter soli]|uniref:NnrS family protein n=1 Tax=Alsobacter soli TaxID=2109933 RepID=UPI001AEC7D8A|nr:NnrS family protein [Alsobacter soli]
MVFFRLASAHAALAGLLWPAARLGLVETARAALAHREELIFGAVPMMIAGFTLTAARRWTGRPVRPDPSAALLGAWGAGILARLSDWPGARAASGALPLLLGAALAIHLLRCRRWRDLTLAALVTGMGAAALAPASLLDQDSAFRLAFALGAALLITLSGRIVPALGRHFLALPPLIPDARSRRLEAVETAFASAALALWAIRPTGGMTALALTALAAQRLAAVARWRVWPMARHPRLLAMLAGALALSVGCAALAWSAAGGGLATAIGVHLLALGGYGLLGLAVMASMVHKRRGAAFAVAPGEVAAYAAMAGALGLRLAGRGLTWGPAAAGACWSAAFLLFLLFTRKATRNLGPKPCQGC